jgi:hypothetical protein
MRYCRDLEFTDKPNYNYLRNLFEKIALREDFSLTDKMYDWSVKAVTITSYPSFFNFY